MALDVNGTWQGAGDVVTAEQWRCGYCDQLTRSNTGYYASRPHNPGISGLIKICGNCQCPTFFVRGEQHPAPAPVGEPIRDVPSDVAELFAQARAALSAGAPVACALTCRKILHHVAVEKRGVGHGKFSNFKEAVEWLNKNHYLPPGGDGWVNFVRDRANEENHQIVLIDSKGAEALLELTGHLLRHVYDLPKRVPAP